MRCRHRAVRPAALTAAILTTAGCVTPASSSTYPDKAKQSLEAAASEIATARITVQALLDHRVLGPYADRTISANENALGSIATTFGSVQPPIGTDALHGNTTALLSDAGDAVAAARIAARRGDVPGLQQALTELGQVARDLDDAEEALP
jgi:hypothetical protein